MMRILSWSQGFGCDKNQTPDFNALLSPEQLSSDPAQTIFPSTVGIKRKRSPSCDESASKLIAAELPNMDYSQDSSRQTLTRIGTPQSNTIPVSDQVDLPIVNEVHVKKIDHSAVKSEVSPRVRKAQDPETRLNVMRQTISTQISLEILLKHKELRLIDQEIAKCQIALEQLRRCSEIPFPATQRPSLAVSEGRGAAVRRTSERFPADSPAPWGVTDGPYTRHYSKWLLPDRRFDGGEPEMVSPDTMSKVNPYGRSTRGHHVDLASKGLLSRSQRANNLKSLPAGYGQPKEKPTGPMILKRKSDNTMVKLVCPDCARHDFGSAQGFINHCRIGHSRSFASHDAAAEACGQPVEHNADGSMKGVEALPSPAVTTPIARTPTSATFAATTVHPLVRSAKSLPQTPTMFHTNPKSSIKPRSNQLEGTASDTKSTQQSKQTPHLSELLKARGLGLNLQDLVTEAKSKIELGDDDDDSQDMALDSPVVVKGGRHPHSGGNKRPASSSMQPSARSLGGKSMSNMPTALIVPSNSYATGLSSPTTESPQAPSLVDSDEELDPQSPVSSDEIDESDIHFAVHDDDNGERDLGLGNGHLSPTQPACEQPVSNLAQVQHSVKRPYDSSTCGQAKPLVGSEEGSNKRRRTD